MYRRLLSTTTSGAHRPGLCWLRGISSGSSAKVKALNVARLDGKLKGEVYISVFGPDVVYYMYTAAVGQHYVSTAAAVQSTTLLCTSMMYQRGDIQQ